MAKKVLSPRKYRVKERRFLNYDGFHGNASIEAYIEHVKKSGRRPTVTLTISDCDNQVNLAFASYSKAERDNDRYKINTLIDVLEKFRAGLNAVYDELDSKDSQDTVEEDYNY